jgi:hypothetical protein
MGNVFDKEGKELKTPAAFHSGELLLEEIEERGIKKTEFAKSIGVLPGNLSEFFKGFRHKRRILDGFAIIIRFNYCPRNGASLSKASCSTPASGGVILACKRFRISLGQPGSKRGTSMES